MADPGQKPAPPLMVSVRQLGHGGTTAFAESERSELPRLFRFQVICRMWYGEPLIPPADCGAVGQPHSERLAIWPPQARTTVPPLVVNVIRIRVEACPVPLVTF